VTSRQVIACIMHANPDTVTKLVVLGWLASQVQVISLIIALSTTPVPTWQVLYLSFIQSIV
jgi:hypothetical protein